MNAIIVSADDYAQSAAIDAGILALIRAGRISAASCLTLCPRWPEAAQLLTADIRQRADIGLHLDFSQYAHFRYRLPVLMLRSFARSLSARKINASIHAQLDSFEASLGTPPDYVDGHQHVHQLPQIRDALLEILLKRYSGELPWLRIARPPLQDSIKGRIIAALGAQQLADKAQAAGLRCSAQLLGVYGFDLDTKNYRHKLQAWLAQAQASANVAVLMCHPAVSSASDHAPADDPIYAARLQEFAVMASDGYPQLLASHGLRLGRGHDLALSPHAPAG